MYAKVLVAVPPGATMTISFAVALAACAGVIAVINVSVTATIVAATPPIVTLLAPIKFVPAMVNTVPPVLGPVFGFTGLVAPKVGMP